MFDRLNAHHQLPAPDVELMALPLLVFIAINDLK